MACFLVYSGSLLASEADQIQSLIARGELRQALSLTDKQLLRDDKSVTYRFLKGLILTRLDELDKARDVFVALTREHPDLPEPYNNLAVIYASQGDFEKAKDALMQAISTHPSYATAHENMGDIYAKMASKAYNQALQLDADNSSAKAKLALVNDLFFVPRNNDEDLELLAKADEEVKKAAEETKKVAEEAKKAAEEQARAVEAARQEAENARRELARLKEQQAREDEERLAEAAKEKARQEAMLAVKAKQDDAARKQAEERAKAEALAMAEKKAQETAQKNANARAKSDEVNRSRVTELVQNWAAAWSAQDAESYIRFYGEEFSPPNKLSRKAWEAQRKVRLARPSYIKVTLGELKVSILGENHAQATFQQKYKSNTYQDSVKKTLILKKSGGDWQITGEHSG